VRSGKAVYTYHDHTVKLHLQAVVYERLICPSVADHGHKVDVAIQDKKYCTV